VAAVQKSLVSPNAHPISTWGSLHPVEILHWPKISDQAKFIYCWMRAQIGARSGSIAVTFREIAGVLDKTESRARCWIRQLIEAGLIERRDCKRGHGGGLDLFVIDYIRVRDLRRLDDPNADQPQLFETVACAPEPSDPIALAIAHPTVCESEESVDTNNILPAGQNEITKLSPPEKTGAPFANMSNIERECINRHGTLNSKVTCHVGSKPSLPQSHPTVSNRAERQALDDIDRRIRQTRAEESPELTPLSNVLARSIDRFSDRSKYDSIKCQIIHQIDQAVIDPELHHSIKGRVADAMLAGQMTDAQFRKILTQVARDHRDGKIKNSPGSLFLFLVRRIVPALRKKKGSKP